MTTAPASHAVPQPNEPPRRRPPLRVVDGRRDKGRRSSAGTAGTVLVVLLFGSVFAVVVFQALLVQSQSQLDALNAKIDSQVNLEKQLRHQVANLESPERIAAAARDRFDMVTPADLGDLQPQADDDARAQWDPAREPIPTTTTRTRSSSGSGSGGGAEREESPLKLPPSTGAGEAGDATASTPVTTKATTKEPSATTRSPATTKKPSATTTVPAAPGGRR